MRKVSFHIKKWAVRLLVTAGALLGITSCCIFKHLSGRNPAEAVYGPPPDLKPQNVKVIEDVYGPPVERIETIEKEDF